MATTLKELNEEYNCFWTEQRRQFGPLAKTREIWASI